MKFRNNPAGYNQFLNEVKQVNYLKNASYELGNQSDREKAVDAYYSFKNDGYILGGHAAARYIERMRRKNGSLIYNYSTIKSLMGMPVNYSDGGSRDIRYYNEIMIISEKDGRIVTIMKQKRIPKKWRKL